MAVVVAFEFAGTERELDAAEKPWVLLIALRPGKEFSYRRDEL